MKFAHISDIHLGSYRSDENLSKLEEKAFKQIMDKCLENGVDFVIISGDLFHNANPDLSTVITCTKKMKELYDKGIRFYMIYGSHDYTPGIISIVDVFDSIGLVTNVFRHKTIGGKLILEFIKDDKTGIKMVGIPAMKKGLENQYYKILDKESLENEDGLKIFVYHSSIKEYIKKSDGEESISINDLPKRFGYYAGGHYHNALHLKLSEYGWIVFAGMPFSARARDISKNIERGFYIVEFNETFGDPKFIPIHVCDHVAYECDVLDKNSIDKLNAIDFHNKIVDVNIKGDEDSPAKESLITRIKNVVRNIGGALHVRVRGSDSVDIYDDDINIDGNDDKDRIEKDILKEKISFIDDIIKTDNLRGEYGIQQAIKLLNIIGEDKDPDEPAIQYKNRKIKEGEISLGISEMI